MWPVNNKWCGYLLVLSISSTTYFIFVNIQIVSGCHRCQRLKCAVAVDVMNPGAETFTVQLSREAAGQPWGFRLQGGADFATPLSVQSVRILLVCRAYFHVR